MSPPSQGGCGILLVWAPVNPTVGVGALLLTIWMTLRAPWCVSGPPAGCTVLVPWGWGGARQPLEAPSWRLTELQGEAGRCWGSKVGVLAQATGSFDSRTPRSQTALDPSQEARVLSGSACVLYIWIAG